MLPVPQMISKSEPTDPLWAISRAAATLKYRHLQSAQSELAREWIQRQMKAPIS